MQKTEQKVAQLCEKCSRTCKQLPVVDVVSCAIFNPRKQNLDLFDEKGVARSVKKKRGKAEKSGGLK